MSRSATFLIIIYCFYLSGCQALVKPQGYADIPLPEPNKIPCCWQAQEQLSLSIEQKGEQQGEQQGHSIKLLSVIVVKPEELNIFLFDNLGHKLATIVQRGDNIRQVINNGLADRLPVNGLLAGFYLANVNADSWQLSDSRWNISKTPSGRALRYAEKIYIRLEMATAPPNASATDSTHNPIAPSTTMSKTTIRSKTLAQAADELTLHYSHPKMSIRVKRLTRDAL